MCHLYDIDSDNTPIKHTQYKHDSVQDAMGVAQAECSFPVTWETALNITKGKFVGSFETYQCYEIVE